MNAPGPDTETLPSHGDRNMVIGGVLGGAAVVGTTAAGVRIAAGCAASSTCRSAVLAADITGTMMANEECATKDVVSCAGHGVSVGKVGGAGDIAKDVGILRDAMRGKGNFGLGSSTAEDAARLGEARVGKGFTVASDGKTLVSSDGLRQFRPPSEKPGLGRTQANFEQRSQPTGQWQANGQRWFGKSEQVG